MLRSLAAVTFLSSCVVLRRALMPLLTDAAISATDFVICFGSFYPSLLASVVVDFLLIAIEIVDF